MATSSSLYFTTCRKLRQYSTRRDSWYLVINIQKTQQWQLSLSAVGRGHSCFAMIIPVYLFETTLIYCQLPRDATAPRDCCRVPSPNEDTALSSLGESLHQFRGRLEQNALKEEKHTVSLRDGAIQIGQVGEYDTVLAVDRDAKTADETAQYLLVVVQQSTEVEDQVEKLSNACEQQTSSAGYISRGLNEIRIVVENSSTTAQNFAAASEELSGQANLMEQMVGQFKV